MHSKSIVAAGSNVLPGTFIASGQFWAGNPAAFIRETTEEEHAEITKVCRVQHYPSIYSLTLLINFTLGAHQYINISIHVFMFMLL